MEEKKSSIGVFLLSSSIVLLGIGFGFLFSASSSVGERFYNNQYYFLIKQLIFLAIGVLFFCVGLLIKVDFYKKNIKFIIIFTIVMLIVTLIPGIGKEVSGGRRWIDLFFFQFQPSEIAKISIIFYLSFVLANKEDFIKDFYRGILPPLILVTFISALILVENDFSTTVLILFTSMIVFFLSGIRIVTLGMILIIGFLGSLLMIFFAQYRVKRLFAFLNPWEDPLGSGWQYIQSMRCFSVGGFFGKGFGESTQKLSNLPEAHNDYIFAIISEEGGGLFAIIIIVIFLIFGFCGLKIARNVNENSDDKSLFLLASGITSMIFIQAMTNIGVVVGILPSTGITLPFMSSGGTSLVIIMFCLGVLYNISRFGGKNRYVK
ncbi:MAG TPA: putative lipid II flippase FtsW [Spirochaetota bacterium]|mgnify:CR=1 FL=1|nr:putative lipid II flippase FtsW [Spirochaetota bacterium]